MSKLSLRLFTNRRLSTVSDPHILKLIQNEQLVGSKTEYSKVILMNELNTKYSRYNIGLYVTKPVFGVSHKASFKAVSSATETSWKIEISPVASLHMILSKKANNKGADQTVRMRRLICACVVRKPTKTGFLTSRPIC